MQILTSRPQSVATLVPKRGEVHRSKAAEVSLQTHAVQERLKTLHVPAAAAAAVECQCNSLPGTGHTHIHTVSETPEPIEEVAEGRGDPGSVVCKHWGGPNHGCRIFPQKSSQQHVKSSPIVDTGSHLATRIRRVVGKGNGH